MVSTNLFCIVHCGEQEGPKTTPAKLETGEDQQKEEEDGGFVLVGLPTECVPGDKDGAAIPL